MTTSPEGNAYTILCAAILGLTCAAALTAAHHVLGPCREANARARDVRNILLALRAPGAGTASSTAATELFTAKVREERHGSLKVYKYMEGDSVRGIAVPFSGRGYAAPIEGFLGLEPDLATIRALTVTYQAETPGLGGQVGSHAFLERFRGKRVDGLRLVRPKGTLGDNEVDAITGATLTSGRFQNILDKTITEVIRLRAERAR
jgi:Na+-transporting NADH:ubiquinone oxidoreductase subunit C